ncbi:serine/threonine-protein kinase RsbW [Saccharicrinis carchari]|uniref:Serine/threonine-protein kinase RsbW n=1 Tax=Saccharicrinis carchari TaxID=1168039 RepID=A0A521CIW4_SACCC|nr:ATP-binding protein [Saccharicrinis carchari]SMO58640.1 serine/threonine-protein kinase RsbW [Saccharicrinis carchari]
MDLAAEKIVINSDIKNISLVEKLIDDISEQYDIHADVYGKLLLAVVEGVNNAIVHGNKLDANKNVQLEYKISDKELQFIITDEGSGFDFTSVPDPTLPENVEKTHGRGVFLMNHLADKINFENDGSKVQLTFLL